ALTERFWKMSSVAWTSRVTIQADAEILVRAPSSVRTMTSCDKDIYALNTDLSGILTRFQSGFEGFPCWDCRLQLGVIMDFLLLATLLLSPDMEGAEALPPTDRILMVHLKEGHVVHHRKGQRRDDGERVILTALDVAAASRP